MLNKIVVPGTQLCFLHIIMHLNLRRRNVNNLASNCKCGCWNPHCLIPIASVFSVFETSLSFSIYEQYFPPHCRIFGDVLNGHSLMKMNLGWDRQKGLYILMALGVNDLQDVHASK